MHTSSEVGVRTRNYGFASYVEVRKGTKVLGHQQLFREITKLEANNQRGGTLRRPPSRNARKQKHLFGEGD